MSKGSTAIYDKIGTGYTSRRRPDPRIFKQIQSALSDCATVLNVGAGTGSYEPPACTLAVEPSQIMIDQRQPGMARCIRAVAENLPLENKSFEGSLACLTVHHWRDLRAGLAEMLRVTRKRVVLFTWDPEYKGDFWLTRDYIPEILALDIPRFPTMRQLGEMLPGIEIHPVPIPADCEDGFLGAFWKRPEAFLDPAVQHTNSAMAQLDPRTVQEGLGRLRDDLGTGTWLQRNASLTELAAHDLGYRLMVSNQN